MCFPDRVQNLAVSSVRKSTIGPARGNNRGPLGRKRNMGMPPHDSAHSWEKVTTQTRPTITGATHHPPHMSPSSWKARSITPNHQKQKVERSRESLEAAPQPKIHHMHTHNLQRTIKVERFIHRAGYPRDSDPGPVRCSCPRAHAR